MELLNGTKQWTPIEVLRTKNAEEEVGLVSSQHQFLSSELRNLDLVEFRFNDINNSPGVILQKGCLEVWTPIVRRTRSKH